MCVPAIDDAGRQRLVEAQRREVEAMRGVAAANRRRAGLQHRIDAADRAVADAHRKLVEVSGLDRAALLTAMPVGELRRMVREDQSQRSADDRS